MPGSSSECERGFRQTKSVKTDTRSCLGEESLADQMTICLHLPSVDELVHCTSKDQCKKCSLKFDMTVEQQNIGSLTVKVEKFNETLYT